MVRVYVNRDLERKLEDMREWTEERDGQVKVVIGGVLTRGRERREEG